MQKYQSYIKTFYILILGFVFSGTLILGAIVAPVVFHSSEFISNVALTRFENGELMSEIFRRFSMILNIAILLIVAMEAMNYKKFFNNMIYVLVLIVFVVSSLLFSFYFTSIILEILHAGEAVINQNIDGFETLHKLSEYDFSVIMISSLAMLIYKISTYCAD